MVKLFNVCCKLIFLTSRDFTDTNIFIFFTAGNYIKVQTDIFNKLTFDFIFTEENEECSLFSTNLIGSPPPTRECGQGLICHEKKCKSFKALSKTSL